jgi:hypothetical protein
VPDEEGSGSKEWKEWKENGKGAGKERRKSQNMKAGAKKDFEDWVTRLAGHFPRVSLSLSLSLSVCVCETCKLPWKASFHFSLLCLSFFSSSSSSSPVGHAYYHTIPKKKPSLFFFFFSLFISTFISLDGERERQGEREIERGGAHMELDPSLQHGIHMVQGLGFRVKV